MRNDNDAALLKIGRYMWRVGETTINVIVNNWQIVRASQCKIALLKFKWIYT